MITEVAKCFLIYKNPLNFRSFLLNYWQTLVYLHCNRIIHVTYIYVTNPLFLTIDNISLQRINILLWICTHEKSLVDSWFVVSFFYFRMMVPLATEYKDLHQLKVKEDDPPKITMVSTSRCLLVLSLPYGKQHLLYYIWNINYTVDVFVLFPTVNKIGKITSEMEVL